MRRLHLLLLALLALVGMTLWDSADERLASPDKSVIARLSGTADAAEVRRVFRAGGWWRATYRTRTWGHNGSPNGTREEWQSGDSRLSIHYDREGRVDVAVFTNGEPVGENWFLRLLGIRPGAFGG